MDRQQFEGVDEGEYIIFSCCDLNMADHPV
jgi:hypothetical protein